MKGFILKDLYLAKNYLKVLPLIAVFFLLFSFRSDAMAALLSLACVFCVVLVLMTCFTSMVYDNSCRWDSYVLTMPVRRRDIVKAKYLLCILLSFGLFLLITLFSLGITCFSGGFSEMQGLFPVLLSILMVLWLLLALLFPLIYRFGVEKARIAILILALAPSVLAGLLGTKDILSGASPLAGFDFSSLLPLLWLSPIAVLLLLYLSYRLSVHLFEQKDL